MLNIDHAMREVMDAYQAITGRAIRPGGTELPPEVDPRAHVETRYRELKMLLGRPGASRSQGAAAMMGPTWAPPADVHELEQELRFEIDLPGVPRDSVDVRVLGDWLIVRGERPNGRAQGTPRHRERSHGAFEKRIALPPGARRDGVDAHLHDGVLVITIPTDESNVHGREVRVDVKSADLK